MIADSPAEPNADPTATPARPRRRPRFSLRSLLLLVLLIGSAGGLWFRWEPWVKMDVLKFPERANVVKFSHDGRFFGTSFVFGPEFINNQTQDGNHELQDFSQFVKIYDAKSFEPVVQILNTQRLDVRADVHSFVFNDDGETINCDGGGEFSLKSGRRIDSKPKYQQLKGEGSVKRHILAVSPDGRHVISRDVPLNQNDDGSFVWGRLCLWDGQTGELVGVLFEDLTAHNTEAKRRAFFVLDGQKVCLEDYETTIRVWRISDLTEPSTIFSVPKDYGYTRYEDFDKPRKDLIFWEWPGQPYEHNPGSFIFDFHLEMPIFFPMRIFHASIVPPFVITAIIEKGESEKQYLMLTVCDHKTGQVIRREYVCWEKSYELPAHYVHGKQFWFVREREKFICWDLKSLSIVGAFPGQTKPFPGGEKWLCNGPDAQQLKIINTNGERLWSFFYGKDEVLINIGSYFMNNFDVSADGKSVVAINGWGHVIRWVNRRPEYWWGVAWLPEFWLTAVFGLALPWSLWRDRREMRAA